MRPRPRAVLRSIVVLLLVAGLAAGACGDDPESAPTTSTRAPGVTTSTTAASDDPREAAVLAAYAASWQAFGELVNGEADGEPADWFDGDQLANVVARITEYEAEGLVLRGEADLSPSAVMLVGAAASLVDCQIDGTYAVERSTGEVVIPSSARPQEVVVELVLVEGRWKVSSVDYGVEGSCER